MEDHSIFDNFNLGDALKESLDQAIAFKNGDKTQARVVVREIPTPNYVAADVQRIRTQLKLSQNGLAIALGVSTIPAHKHHLHIEKFSH